MGPKCYAVQGIVNEEENSRNCPFPLGFCHPAGGALSHSQRLHAQKIGKVITLITYHRLRCSKLIRCISVHGELLGTWVKYNQNYFYLCPFWELSYRSDLPMAFNV